MKKIALVLVALSLSVFIAGCTELPSANIAGNQQNYAKAPQGYVSIPCNTEDQCIEHFRGGGVPDDLISQMGIYCTGGQCYGKTS